MANRLTKGKGLFGSLRTNGPVRAARVSETRAANTVADGASMVISAAQFYTDGIVSATPTTGRNIQAPTAASIIALANGYSTGDTFEFTLINLAAATHALTLTVNTGLTIVGSASVAAASSGTFMCRVASSTTVVLYRK
jgi:hypothetical protein